MSPIDSGSSCALTDRQRLWHYAALALVVLVGGALRFWELNVPGLWRDESAVFWRTCGTYGQMLDILQYDAFMPLHYEMYFALSRFVPLSPHVMRVIPATAGTLLIPAVYFLAVQMFSRRVALMAATLTAGSAFLFSFSRDAKMYSHFYLACVLSVGCLLWFLRTRSLVAWLAWVAASQVMVGLHALGLIVLALQPLIQITHRRGVTWKAAAALIGGMVIITFGVWMHTTYFNQLKQKIDREGWHASGLDWIEDEIRGDSGADMVEYLVVQQVFTGQRKEMRINDPKIPRFLHVFRWATLAIIVAGVFPWPTRRRRDLQAAEAWWRPVFWLLVCIVVPPYLFYCASVPDFAWPAEALVSAFTWAGWMGSGLFIMAAAGALLMCAPTWPQRLEKARVLLAVLLAIGLICTVIAAVLDGRALKPVWMARYFGYIVAPLLIAFAALLNRLPGRLAWVGVGLFVLTNLPHYPGTLLRPHQRSIVERIALDAAASQAEDSPVRLYSLPAKSHGFARFASFNHIDSRYYLFWATGRPTYPDEFLEGDMGSMFRIRNNVALDQVRSEVAGAPSIQKLVIWEDMKKLPADQQPEPLQVPGFQPVRTTVHHHRIVVDVRMEDYSVVRHELVRSGR